MSDLESTGAHARAAVPVSAAALGKLRAMGGAAAVFGETDGLVDAFAEVFARIAASEPIQVQDTSVENDRAPEVTDDGPTNHEDSKARDSESSDSETESKVDVDPIVVALVQDEAASEIDDAGAELVAIDPEQAVTEVEPEQSIDLERGDAADAAVVVPQTDQPTEQIEAPDTIVQEVVQHDLGGEDRDRRRQTERLNPVDNATDGRWRGERTPQETEPLDGPGEDLGLAEQEWSHGSETAVEGEDSPRRTRGRRRYDRGDSGEPVQQIQQTQQNRAGQRAATAVADNAAVEAAASHSESAAIEARPTPRRVDSAVVAAQALASSASRAAASAGGPTNAAAGSRGLIQGVEPSAPRPEAANAKKTDTAKTNTAETLSRVRLIQRVSKAFQHLGPEGGVVRLRLAPAEMGSVRVEMRIHQRKINARVVAETEAASTALREHLPELRQRLESQGMQVERLEIEADAGDASFSSTADHQGHSRWRESAGEQPSRKDPQPETVQRQDVPTATVSRDIVSQPSTSSGIDLRL